MRDLSEYMSLDEVSQLYESESGLDMPLPLLQVGLRTAGVESTVEGETVYFRRSDVIDELPNYMRAVKVGREKRALAERLESLERRLAVVEARLSPTTAAAGA